MRGRLIHAALGAGLILPLGLALNYALNVVLARMLSVEDFGLFGVVQSLTAVAGVVGTLGFSQSAMRFTAAYFGNGQFDLLSGFLRSSVLVVLGSSAVVALGFVTAAWFASSSADVFLWSAALVVPLAISVWRESAMRGFHLTAEAIAPRQVALPMLMLFLVIGLGLHDVHTALAAYLVLVLGLELAAYLRLRSYLARVAKNVAPRLELREWVRVSAPMALTSLAVQGMARWDVIVVGILLSLEEAGLYAAAARTALLANLVLRGINLIVAPMLAETYHTAGPKRFRRLFIGATLASGLIGFPFYLAVLLYPDRVLLLFGPTYTDGALILQILATGQFVNLLTGPAATALNMSEHEWVLARAAIFFGIGSLVLIVTAGLIGDATAVAVVTATIAIVFNLSLFILLWRRLS